MIYVSHSFLVSHKFSSPADWFQSFAKNVIEIFGDLTGLEVFPRSFLLVLYTLNFMTALQQAKNEILTDF